MNKYRNLNVRLKIDEYEKLQKLAEMMSGLGRISQPMLTRLVTEYLLKDVYPKAVISYKEQEINKLNKY